MPLPTIVGAVFIVLSILLAALGIGGSQSITVEHHTAAQGTTTTTDDAAAQEPSSALVPLPPQAQRVQPGSAMKLMLRGGFVGVDVKSITVQATDPKSDAPSQKLPGPDWYSMYAIDGCRRRLYGVHSPNNGATIEGFKPLYRNPGPCTSPHDKRIHHEFYEVFKPGMSMYYYDDMFYLVNGDKAIRFRQIESAH